jgi:hypothetical protein
MLINAYNIKSIRLPLKETANSNNKNFLISAFKQKYRGRGKKWDLN